MSIDQARRFIQRVQEDDGFRERVLSEGDVEARMELIRREGYDCTAEEIAGLLLALSDAALEGLTGDGDAPPEPADPGPGCRIYHPN